MPAAFRTHVLNTPSKDQASALTPVRVLGSVSFMYLRHNDVYILFVTKRNANAMLAFSFMSQVREKTHTQNTKPEAINHARGGEGRPGCS